jgi:hypothetical protein
MTDSAQPWLDHDPIGFDRITISSLCLSMIFRKTGFHFSGSCSSLWFEHDLFGKPASTFPDHAPGLDAQQNPRSGKRLGDEIYVASEASATPLRNYAPQSNFSPSAGVALPWSPGIEVLSSLTFHCCQAWPTG